MSYETGSAFAFAFSAGEVSFGSEALAFGVVMSRLSSGLAGLAKPYKPVHDFKKSVYGNHIYERKHQGVEVLDSV